MIPTPFTFEEVAQEVSFAQAKHLDHTKFGKARERFNTVHVVFSTSELIFVIMNPIMSVTIEDHRRSQAVRVDRAISLNLTFNEGPQRVARAVIDNFDVCTTPSLKQTYDRNLTTSATYTSAAYSPQLSMGFMSACRTHMAQIIAGEHVLDNLPSDSG